MDFSGLISASGDISSIAVLAFIIRQHIDVQLLKCELRNLKEQFTTWKETHT